MALEGMWMEARVVAQAVMDAGGSGAYRYSAISVLAPLAREQGDAALAWSLVREVLPSGPTSPPGESTWFRDALVLQRVAVRLALDGGDMALAGEWLACHDRWVSWAGDVPGRTEQHLLRAEYYRAAGDAGHAHAAATQAHDAAIAPSQPLALLTAHRLLADLDTGASRFGDADEHLRKSLDLANACAAPFERALALLSLAALSVARRTADEAHVALGEARTIFERLGAKRSIARADALAARLANVRDAKSALPAGLSAREVEVLRHVAAGQTSRVIAESLFLSVVTVNNHIAHILTKTGCANRAEAAAFAQRHGLI